MFSVDNEIDKRIEQRDSIDNRTNENKQAEYFSNVSKQLIGGEAELD